MRREVVRRRSEVAPPQLERREDVLLDVVFPRVAANLLDDAREIDETGIRVAVARARTKLELLIRHHRHELVPRRRLERLPGPALAVRPRPVLKALSLIHI